MRIFPIALTCLAIGLFAPAASAQSRSPIKIARVQVGYPAGPFSNQGGDEEGGRQMLFRAGAWAPVWVDLECNERLDEYGPLEIVVEALDGDEITAVSRVPLVPPMQPGEHRTGVQLGVIPYVKPGHFLGEITTSVRTARGRNVADPHKRTVEATAPSRYSILTIGSSLNGLWLPVTEGSDPHDRPERARELRNGNVVLAEATEATRLPDKWIGYDGVDLVILTTGGDLAYWDKLGTDHRRMAALAEWVRRGGRLLISAGTNAEILLDDRLREIRDMLPATLPAGGKRTVDTVRIEWLARTLSEARLLGDPEAKEGRITLATLNPRADRSARVVMPPRDSKDPNAPPIVVQGSYGSGRVTIVGFDLDGQMLTNWQHKASFWEWLLGESGHHLPSGQEARSGSSRSFSDDNEDQYVTALQNMLDSFEGVPVVSFGWVALFILIYILLIGPVDYLFLKRVLKRMEWTWVTFPVIVIAVSAIAYFTAYALKGRDLKINKVDLVDVDLQSKRIYGHTWFTMFSPRIQSYTVGVEPGGTRDDDARDRFAWTPDTAAESLPNTTVSWQGRPRIGTERFIRRDYRYHSDLSNPDQLDFAAGLEQVPIQVWSTKAFTASWSAQFDPQRFLEVKLVHPGDDPDKIMGTITSHLPVVIPEAYMLFRERAIALGPLTPGVDRTVIQRNEQAISNALDGNLDSGRALHSYGPSGNRAGAPLGTYSLWRLLFHERFGGPSSLNASVRELDQSWRVGPNSREQAVLVMRLRITEDGAEAMSRKPEVPTRLWLNSIPGGKAAREPLAGTLRQETYIRVFIPVTPIEKK